MQNPPEPDRERAATALFYGAVLLLGYFFFRIVSPFLAPLGWAAVLAISVHPAFRRLAPRYGAGWAALLSTFAVGMLIIGPGLAILAAFVQESRAAIANVDQNVLAGQLAVLEEAWNRVRPLLPGAQSLELQTLVNDVVSRVGGFLAGRVGGLLADIAVFLFQLLVMLIALYFFLRDSNAIMREVRRLLPFEPARRERMIRQTQELIYASVAAALVIASLQGLAGGVTFALLGLGAPVFWGVIMGFLAFLPVVGPWVVWGPAAIWLIATGDLWKGVALIIIGAAVIGTVDNILRPAILSGRAQMNGLLMFISLLGGVSVFGLLGLVLGPLVTAMVAGLVEAYGESADAEGTAPATAAPADGPLH